ncbi:transcriptional regulator [Klebsiella oxytoca]|uniref:Transcriptional regulator n=1 Tax=Klebsiella oxytoca TaxID=571 RepID=A0AAP2BIR5_KLEOX|nr:transcriptional regulator [Klebsiella oxytoca]MBQ0600780.1 transcriptional regulator [Klebsiella oxytoca]
MNIKPIRNEQDHRDALAVVEKLLAKSPAPDSPESERLEVMIMLVEAYENRCYPILSVSPVEAIKFRMNELGLSVEDIAPAMGNVQCAKNVLDGSQTLTLTMIRQLHSQFGIPLESLVGV